MTEEYPTKEGSRTSLRVKRAGAVTLAAALAAGVGLAAAGCANKDAGPQQVSRTIDCRITANGNRVVSNWPQTIVYDGGGKETRKWATETSVLTGRFTGSPQQVNALPSPLASGFRHEGLLQLVWVAVSFDTEHPDKPQFVYEPTGIPNDWPNHRFEFHPEDTRLLHMPYLLNEGFYDVRTGQKYPEYADRVIVGCGETLQGDKTRVISIPPQATVIGG